MAEKKTDWGQLAIVSCVVAGVGFYEWLLFTRWPALDHWGNLGSAVGPVATIFSAVAVFAALRSIALQREALAGQQTELNKQQAQIERHMTLLEEQRAQFARSADAHEALARAQLETAAAQRSNTIAILLATRLEQSVVLTMQGSEKDTQGRQELLNIVAEHAARLKARLATELSKETLLESVRSNA